MSIAGSQNQIAVATALGKILYFNATTLAQAGTISFASGALALSSDGSLLAAAPNQVASQGFPSLSLNIYSMPSASLLYSWPYPFSSNLPDVLGFQAVASDTLPLDTLAGSHVVFVSG